LPFQAFSGLSSLFGPLSATLHLAILNEKLVSKSFVHFQNYALHVLLKEAHAVFSRLFVGITRAKRKRFLIFSPKSCDLVLVSTKLTAATIGRGNLAKLGETWRNYRKISGI